VRLGMSEADVTKTSDEGLIIRTHVLRPTWHLIAASDARWMLALTAQNVKKLYLPMCGRKGIDEQQLRQYGTAIGRMLRNGNYKTREEIMSELKLAVDPDSGIRASLIMMHAEQEAIVCNGPMRGKEFTYALFDEIVPVSAPIDRDQALAMLAERYFVSHGPATLRDFIWWSGLPVADAKRGLEAAKKQLISFDAAGGTYWLHHKHSSPQPATHTQIHLLPAFDEYLISYTDRTAAISPEHQPLAFTRNGIFKPVIVADGRVVGTWKRTIKKSGIHIESAWFGDVSKAHHQLVRESADKYAAFCGVDEVQM
jgi:hypothetical protein